MGEAEGVGEKEVEGEGARKNYEKIKKHFCMYPYILHAYIDLCMYR